MTDNINATASPTDNHIANEILNQLGGYRFIVMTGSRDFVSGNDSLTFRLPTRMAKGNHVRITLTGRDDYTIELFRIRDFTPHPVGKSEGVMCDGLKRAFSEVTGLAVSL